jgi:hypothetical protein
MTRGAKVASIAAVAAAIATPVGLSATSAAADHSFNNRIWRRPVRLAAPRHSVNRLGGLLCSP